MNLIIIGAGAIGSALMQVIALNTNDLVLIVDTQEIVKKQIQEQEILKFDQDLFLIRQTNETLFTQEEVEILTLNTENYLEIGVNKKDKLCWNCIILPILQLDWSYG